MGRKPAGVPLNQSIYESLRREILEWKLVPGEPISEIEVGRRLGGSRTPVREALQLLSREGLVRLIPGRGAFVSSLSPQSLVELFQVREALYVEAVRLAAGSEGRQERLGPVISAFEAGKETVRAGSLEAFFDLCRSMDAAISELAGNGRLRAMLEEVNSQVYRTRHIRTREIGRLLQSLNEKLQVVKLVARGDVPRAEEAIRYSIARSLNHMLLSALGRPPRRGRAARPSSGD